MLPGTWLPESDNTGGIPFEGPLPDPYEGTYSEGGNGTFLGTTEIDFVEVSVHFISSFIEETFGFGPEPGLSPTLRIRFIQPSVFGVLLLDSFKPPLVAGEFFQFPAYVQDACTATALVGVAVDFGSCTVGAETEYLEAGQVTPTYEDA